MVRVGGGWNPDGARAGVWKNRRFRKTPWGTAQTQGMTGGMEWWTKWLNDSWEGHGQGRKGVGTL